jgi:hypothetical protein
MHVPCEIPAIMVMDTSGGYYAQMFRGTQFPNCFLSYPLPCLFIYSAVSGLAVPCKCQEFAR